MTMIREIGSRARKVSEMVMEGLSLRTRLVLSREERELAVHLRGNDVLYYALTELIRFRIHGRDGLAVPVDPLVCKGILERNNELRWLLARLELLYRSPANTESEQGEQPAA